MISHLQESEEHIFFKALRGMLATSGEFLILDSAWSAERAKYNAKVEHQERRLNDGTRFEIYKQYCDRADTANWADRYGATIDVVHFGTAFFAVSGNFESP